MQSYESNSSSHEKHVAKIDALQTSKSQDRFNPSLYDTNEYFLRDQRDFECISKKASSRKQIYEEHFEPLLSTPKLLEKSVQ